MWRVLLVDDSALVRNAMQAAIEPLGLDIGHAENGQVAVDKVAASSWDLIFLDVVMPVMDGPTALAQIRATGDQTPVVLVTSVSTARVVASAVKLGAVHYIAKPFTPDQIRAVATRLLKLDVAAMGPTPRVLLQHADPALPARLRKLLPAHVAIDASQSLVQSLDLAEHGGHGLAILESRELVDEMGAIANVLRRVLPAAGIFAISDSASASSPWAPDEGLDGVLPRALDDALVRGFLYATCLRPLVALDGMVARVAGFHGAPAHLPAYLEMLTRRLVDRCAKLDATADLVIDVGRVPAEPDTLVAVVTAANRALRDAGVSPSFRIDGAMQAATAGRLDRVSLV